MMTLQIPNSRQGPRKRRYQTEHAQSIKQSNTHTLDAGFFRAHASDVHCSCGGGDCGRSSCRGRASYMGGRCYERCRSEQMLMRGQNKCTTWEVWMCTT